MKKILYLHAGAELYGADIVLLELLKGLDKTKVQPYVILPNNGELVDKLKKENINVAVLEYPILRRSIFTITGLPIYLYKYLKYSFKLLKFVKKEKIEVVHSNTAAVLEGVFLKMFSKVNHIWHIHEIIVKPKIVHIVVSYMISRFSDEVVVVSEAVKNHLEKTKLFKHKEINVIYNGIDNSKFNPNISYTSLKEEFQIPKYSKVVGMIGRVNSWKGQKDFLQAIEPILDGHGDVYAMLVGGVFEGEEWRFEELLATINKMKSKERIIVCSYRNDVPNIHALYDIFVLPSINPDPLPTVVLEAMGTGTPIVGYKHGGVCEMVLDGHNGYLIEPRNTNLMTQHIELLLNDDNLLKNMSELSAKRQQELFSLEAYIDKFEKLYLNLKR